MSRSISIRTLLGIALLLAAVMKPSPASAQHGHGGSHGFGGHGGGHGFGGHGYAGHGLAGHIYGGHGYGLNYGVGVGHQVHGGLHDYSHNSYGHYWDGHTFGHVYARHGYGLFDYGHGGDLYGYGYHEYYPHSYDHTYPYDYDNFSYFYWYPPLSVSLYPWYGFYGVDGDSASVVLNLPLIIGDGTNHDNASAAIEQNSDPMQDTVSAQVRLYKQRAESAFRDRRYHEALRLVNHALVEMPRNGKLLLLVSQTLFANHDYRGAAATIHQAAAILNKDELGYVVKNWRAYYRGTAYREAMDKLNDYVKENPDVAYARFLRAYHFGFLGQEEFARKEMAKAIELESRDRLAVELLIMFGGDPPPGDADRTDVNAERGSDSGNAAAQRNRASDSNASRGN